MLVTMQMTILAWFLTSRSYANLICPKPWRPEAWIVDIALQILFLSLNEREPYLTECLPSLGQRSKSNNGTGFDGWPNIVFEN